MMDTSIINNGNTLIYNILFSYVNNKMNQLNLEQMNQLQLEEYLKSELRGDILLELEEDEDIDIDALEEEVLSNFNSNYLLAKNNQRQSNTKHGNFNNSYILISMISN